MTAKASNTFTVTPGTVLIDPESTFASKYLNSMFAKGAGFRLASARVGVNRPAIRFRHSSALKTEGYELHVKPNGITIRYGDSAGAFYAVQTLRQLLPSAIEGPKPSHISWTVPGVDIADSPRFSWRGLHLDVSRHFFPVSFIKKYIDYIAMMKGNIFHWHLVDDGGWRIQIAKYPKLTSVGAWRYGVTTGWDQSKLRFDPSSGLPKYGGFYTKQEIRDVVKYAQDRNVTIIPEIEMPGHTMPVLAAYPELGCKNQLPTPLKGQPPTNVYCAGNEKTYKFIQDVLDEVMDLFPSQWIHIGGDEVDKEYWHRCPVCQARMKQNGLKNEEQLQSYFVRRIDKYLASKGRRLIGWDEILEGGLAKGATVMSWRGVDGGIKAAKSGHDVVMSPGSHAYFDASYADQPTEHVYTFDPVPPTLTAKEAKHVLGGQANIWCERIPTEARVEYMIFPRMVAMAETLWSPKAGRDVKEFMQRLPAVYDRLSRMGAAYYMPAPNVGMTAYLFKDSATVTVPLDKRIPGTMRYTLDGSVPNGSSPAYTGPISVDKLTTMQFAYVNGAGKAGEVTKVYCAPAGPTDADSATNGWKVGYYQGHWDNVPDFSQLTPQREDTPTAFGLKTRHRAEFFALDFKTTFTAEKDGLYEFNLGSDDGSWLKLAGAVVVDNDGDHAMSIKTGKVKLAKGSYPMEIGYFQAGGGLGLSLSVLAPGDLRPTDIDRYLKQTSH